LLARVGLQEQAGLDAQKLPYGAKKRLELAMALAGLEDAPGLLLLDEPAAGLAASERAALMQLVRALTHDADGRARLAVLYTEHNMDAVFGVAERVLVLMEGRLVASGTAAQVAANDLVRTHYLGRGFSHAREAHHA
jgi:branched-chain amino acid transport system ATP-binding protein